MLIVLHESSKLKKSRRIQQLSWSSIKSAFSEPTMEDWLQRFYPQFKGIPVTNCLHHQSHAAAGMLTVTDEDWRDAAIVTIDAIGEKQTATISTWESGKRIQLRHEVNFPNSLGLFYSAVTSYVDLKPMEDEYILMGMAAYGKPVYKERMEKELCTHSVDDWHNCLETIDMSKGLPKDFISKEEYEFDTKKVKFDLAASAQAVVEERVIAYCRLAFKYSGGSRNLVYMGGVALNCVANGKILKEKIFENIWVQPAAGDAGGSLGAALALWHIDQGNNRIVNPKDDMKGSYLGSEFSQNQIEKELSSIGAKFRIVDYDNLIDQTSDFLAKEKAIGWFQGRMEFGPRALGCRSILGDPRSDKMQKNLNLKVKYRESFRPFAPSVLREDLSNWFNLKTDSPYMLLVGNINLDKKIEMTDEQKKLFGIEKLNIKRSEIPAVTHVDYSARIQTVTKDTNKPYYDLISKFKEKTGCPVIVNTSFNVRGEPIVNSPTDAFNCFMGTELDYLIIGNCILDKNEQDPSLKKDYTKEFELD